MIHRRPIALLGFLLCLSLLARAQQLPSSLDGGQLTDQQMLVLDSLAADSIHGELVVPNVFSPNGDGSNDYLEVHTDGNTVYEFMVYSRSGLRVFHSKSPRVFWDGKSSGGQDLQAGVYYYVLEEDGGNDPVQKVGFIYLYR